MNFIPDGFVKLTFCTPADVETQSSLILFKSNMHETQKAGEEKSNQVISTIFMKLNRDSRC